MSELVGGLMILGLILALATDPSLGYWISMAMIAFVVYVFWRFMVPAMFGNVADAGSQLVDEYSTAIDLLGKADKAKTMEEKASIAGHLLPADFSESDVGKMLRVMEGRIAQLRLAIAELTIQHKSAAICVAIAFFIHWRVTALVVGGYALCRILFDNYTPVVTAEKPTATEAGDEPAPPAELPTVTPSPITSVPAAEDPS